MYLSFEVATAAADAHVHLLIAHLGAQAKGYPLIFVIIDLFAFSVLLTSFLSFCLEDASTMNQKSISLSGYSEKWQL